MHRYRHTQRNIENVLITVFEDEHSTIGFPIHSFSTFERVGKYDERKNTKNGEKPYSIEIGDTKRAINLYAIASLRFDSTFE